MCEEVISNVGGNGARNGAQFDVVSRGSLHQNGGKLENGVLL